MSVEARSGYDLITVTGELDVSTRHRVDECVASLDGTDGERIVVDLRGVTFLDSSGIGSLISANRDARARGVALSIVCGDDHVRRVLRIARLEQVMDIESTLP